MKTLYKLFLNGLKVLLYTFIILLGLAGIATYAEYQLNKPITDPIVLRQSLIIAILECQRTRVEAVCHDINQLKLCLNGQKEYCPVKIKY